MDINLTTGERRFRKAIFFKFRNGIFLTPKEIKNSFPEMKQGVISFYISTLSKKGWLLKIKNGLYYVPKIDFTYEELKLKILTKHIGFKREVKLYPDHNNKILWLGIDKKDKKNLKKFRELYKRIGISLDNNNAKWEKFNSEFKVRVIYKQNIAPLGTKAWSRFYNQEVKKQITTIKAIKEKHYDRRGNPIE